MNIIHPLASEMISNFKYIRNLSKIINNEIIIKYYHLDKEISLINYNIFSGEIKYIYVNPMYQNKGIATRILNNVINEMDIFYNKEVWCISGKNHIFWNNVYNKSFTYRYPIQPYSPYNKYGGFYMKL